MCQGTFVGCAYPTLAIEAVSKRYVRPSSVFQGLFTRNFFQSMSVVHAVIV